MTRNEVLTELKKILLPYTPDKTKLDYINDQTNLLKDLKINSANLVDIIIDAENNYNIEIDNDAVEKMVNVGNIIDVILKKLETS